MSGKTVLDFDRDTEVTGVEIIYAVDDNKDVNITTEQIKNYVTKELNKTGVATVKLSSEGW